MEYSLSIPITEEYLSKAFQDSVRTVISQNVKPEHFDLNLTVSEAAEYLKCGRTYLWLRRKDGSLKSMSLGKKILFRKSELDRFLQCETEGRRSASL